MKKKELLKFLENYPDDTLLVVEDRDHVYRPLSVWVALAEKEGVELVEASHQSDKKFSVIVFQ